MDFSQLVSEYSFRTQNRVIGTQWWKDQKWNLQSKVRSSAAVERNLARQDYFQGISVKWQNCYNWLVKNNILKSQVNCLTCKHPMQLSDYGKGKGNNRRVWRCTPCLSQRSVLECSHLNKMTQSLQEFIRIVFLYFCKGYEPELTHRELTENVADGGAQIRQTSVYCLYVLARDRISKHAIQSVQNKKFGGPQKEVHIDFLKLHLKSLKNPKSTEYIVLGFIESQTGRVRGYLVPNCKAQTVVQYLAKTVERGSIIYSPFYQETGWEFLDKYFDHRRLITEKGKSYKYENELYNFQAQTGFGKLW